MSEPRRPPVFCDHCANLAVAELDSAPLCTTCLLREIGASGARLEARRLVAPLNLVSVRDSTPVPPPPRVLPGLPLAAPAVDEAVSC